MKFYTKLGYYLTALWLLVVLFLLVSNCEALPTMTLNEWGDFLAGTTAPLALFWLVIGYFQHGEELRLNTEALNAQKEELRRQVQETATLAENSERQAQEAERLAQITKAGIDREAARESREAKPVFVSQGGGRSASDGRVTTKIRNRGGEAYNVRVHYEGPYEVSFSPIQIFDKDKIANLSIKEGSEPIQFPIQLRIDCTDCLGTKLELWFELQENHKLFEVAANAP